MKRHIVRQGESIGQLAVRYGLAPDTIWDDPNNRLLREGRPSKHVLCAGDEVFIRKIEGKDEQGETEKRHRFRRKGVPGGLFIRVQDPFGPRANEPYRIDIDGKIQQGMTDSDGCIRITIPPDAQEGRLLVGEAANESEYPLKIGHLNPIDTVSGVQQRLHNLGFRPGPADDKVGPKTKAAIQAFQEAHDLEPTCELDDATRSKLNENHGT